MAEVNAALHNALGVIVLDPKISAWLAENDPKALEQATTAFKAAGHVELVATSVLATCPQCDSTDLREWGKASVGGDIAAVTAYTDPKTGVVFCECEWEGDMQVELDDFVADEVRCRNCDHAAPIEDFVRPDGP